ncbi:MAG: DUF1385 domain-containing protein [Oscillospiraceae bacterium]|jgi:uncharacterized protein YqhQ|nr:DUF1385 domain-containing protein [Oscillospiraceae bacterium]
MKEKFKTTIGGQALIEGVMMRGPETSSMSVRLPGGEIETETWPTKPRQWYNKIPVLRGMFNFIASILEGYRTLMKSAQKLGLDDEEELSPFEKKLMEKLGKNFMNVLVGLASVFAILLAVVLFVFIPTFTSKFLGDKFNLGLWRNIIEGGIRMAIFIGYMWAISKMDEIRRVYQYHGAEHKSIACYESGMELTPENAAACSRFHPRCGTSFLFITLIISIVVFSFVTWDTLWLRFALKLATLPIVIGLSYEMIQLAGKHYNIVTRILSAPGLWVQRLSTAEPDEKQLEVAIAALKAAQPREEGADRF